MLLEILIRQTYESFYIIIFVIYALIVLRKLTKIRHNNGNKLMYLLAVIAFSIRACDILNITFIGINPLSAFLNSFFYLTISILITSCGIFIDKKFLNSDGTKVVSTYSNLKTDAMQIYNYLKDNKALLYFLITWNFILGCLLFSQALYPKSDIILISRNFYIVLSYLLIAYTLFNAGSKTEIPYEIRQTIDIIITCIIFIAGINALMTFDWQLYFKYFITIQGTNYACEIATIHYLSKLLPNEEKVEFMEFNPLAI